MALICPTLTFEHTHSDRLREEPHDERDSGLQRRRRFEVCLLCVVLGATWTLSACVGGAPGEGEPGEASSGGDVSAEPGEPSGPGGRSAPGGAPGGLSGGESGGFDEGCGEELAQVDRPFERALCLCGELADVGQGLRTRSYSRTFGRHEGHGHVGVNGKVDVIGYARVEGNLDVGRSVQGIGKLTTDGDLRSGGDFGGLGSYVVFGDARVNGDLQGIGQIKVEGDLFLNGRQGNLGSMEAGSVRGSYEHPSAPPCECRGAGVIDVAAEVARRRTQNNNSALPTGGIGFQEVTLRAGEYYFDSVDALVGAAKLRVEGRVAIFLDDDLDAVGHLGVELAPQAELALWVRGSVRSIGNLRFARQEDVRARAFKLYVGGAEAAIVNVGNARFFGGVYAPQADIGFVGNLQVHGAVFARNLRGAGNLEIFYDTDIVVPNDCIDDHPEVVPRDPDETCKDDDECDDDEVCDELTHECVDEGECEDDGECPGADRCIDGQCIVL